MGTFVIRKSRIDILVERWSSAFKIFGHIVDIYENPGPSDVQEMAKKGSKRIRILADSQKKIVYAWNAASALHSDVYAELGYTGKYYDNPHILTGDVEGEYADPSNIPYMSSTTKKVFLEQDWSFVSKYFNIKDILKLIDAAKRKA